MAVEETSPRLKWISKAIVRLYFKLFHQYEALGQEHLPPSPPVLIITNHVSNLDVPAFAYGQMLPTCEAIAAYIYPRISARLPAGVELERVRIVEDSTLYADCTGLP